MGRPCNCCGGYYGPETCYACYDGPETLTAAVSEFNCGPGGSSSQGCLSVGSFLLHRSSSGPPIDTSIFQWSTPDWVTLGCGVRCLMDVRCYCRGEDNWRKYEVSGDAFSPPYGLTFVRYCNVPVYEPPGTPVLIEYSVPIIIQNFFGPPVPIVDEVTIKFTITE